MIKLYIFYNHNNEQVFLLNYKTIRKMIHISQFNFSENGHGEKSIELFFSFLDNFKLWVRIGLGEVIEIENGEEIFDTILRFYTCNSINNTPTKHNKLVEIV